MKKIRVRILSTWLAFQLIRENQVQNQVQIFSEEENDIFEIFF